MSLYIGLMSGTSMDGIDAALVNPDTHQLIQGITYPYPAALKAQLLDFNPSKPYTLQSLLELHHLIGQSFSDATLALLKQTPYQASDITAIGSHGQTVYHSPNTTIPATLQLGCPHTIAEKTGITVVADFRTRDLILGGQGAPLAPCYHKECFKNENLPLAVVNIGGISNITFLDQSASPIGYDTGPGNTLMDAWIRKHKSLPYDANGNWARTGTIIPTLLKALLNDAYFKKEAPKSIDKSYYSLTWLEQYIEAGQKTEDIQATLLHLTARSIADVIQNSYIPCTQVLLCGGGAHNQALIDALSSYLPLLSVHTSHIAHIDPNYLEAMMFAWFAKQTLNHNSLDLTAITGAKKPAILGAIYL
ncbi:MAG: anhydro-N-acetylmuramic acid kinase [Legionellaceae bacterium]|nr:anhydro-N-acetylmuramic acid kinase [Legionellaceae bacterium]